MFVKGKSTLYEILPYVEGDIIQIKDFSISDKGEEVYYGPSSNINKLKPWLNRIVAGLRLLPYYIEVKLQDEGIYE